uniref:TLDc domain-containing protein n=1 Tax=Glycine max TaxID=3847 RepID=A0A0R0KM09_SOYBN
MIRRINFMCLQKIMWDDKNAMELDTLGFQIWCTGRPGYQIPKLLTSKAIDSNIILLRKEYTWHIGGALSHQDLEDWNLLYHSSVNGLSFNTFLGNISNHAGPTVLIIKDKEGYIYGGYASQPWERHADFYGDLKCFLFQLNPVASIFRPTGANNNLQWCAINFSSEDIPNGIGFGGRVNHLGLFISANFDQGHTFSCTTFGSPCLSKTNRILPEVIECWGVTQDATQDKNDAVKGTILERFKEDRNMLKMVGLANSSE